jgi:hypothetical protein
MRIFWFALLLFVLVRGLTDTEPFDLSLPLWAIVMISILIEDKQTMGDKEPVGNLVGQSDMAGTSEPLSSYQ